jgi:ferredoxin
MERKEKSKVICKHLSKNIFGFKDNESVYVAAVMDALKEIENIEREDYKRTTRAYEGCIRD